LTCSHLGNAGNAIFCSLAEGIETIVPDDDKRRAWQEARVTDHGLK